MPTVGEMRRRLRDGKIAKRLKFVAAMKKKRNEVNFSITVDGKDARLAFGKHKGQKLGEIIGFPDGKGYLNWLVNNSDSSIELKDVARYQMRFAEEQTRVGRYCRNCEWNANMSQCPRTVMESTRNQSPACSEWVEFDG